MYYYDSDLKNRLTKMTAAYLPASESLESLESLLSESDELLLLALSRRAGTEETLALADGASDTVCSVQRHISLSASLTCMQHQSVSPSQTWYCTVLLIKTITMHLLQSACPISLETTRRKTLAHTAEGH